MKIASLLVPAYLPRAYAGATPTPYQSGTMDKFEKALVDLSPLVIRNHNGTRLHPDTAGRFVHQEVVTQYDLLVDPETTTLAEAIDLALRVFTLENITVIFDGDAAPCTKEDADALSAGVHAWSVPL